MLISGTNIHEAKRIAVQRWISSSGDVCWIEIVIDTAGGQLTTSVYIEPTAQIVQLDPVNNAPRIELVEGGNAW